MPNSPRSSKRSAPSLRIEPRPSRIGRVALLSVTALALLALQRSALPTAALLAAVPMVIALAWRGGRALFDPPILAAALQADGSWLLSTADGDQPAGLVEYSLLAGSIGLIFVSAGAIRRWRWMLWPDSLPSDQRRRLLVWLRSSRAAAVRGAGEGVA